MPLSRATVFQPALAGRLVAAVRVKIAKQRLTREIIVVGV
jgi:hypothetical protein